ncbi:hypothetical protein [Enterobacter sp.]
MVDETPPYIREAERWQVPNKLRDMRKGRA